MAARLPKPVVIKSMRRRRDHGRPSPAPPQRPLAKLYRPGHHGHMFTIEHEFDATVITLVDDGPAPLKEDVTVNAFSECITVEQYDPRTDTVVMITLSIAQLRDLGAALDLPEGAYLLNETTRK